jgi:alpha-L-fucosidase
MTRPAPFLTVAFAALLAFAAATSRLIAADSAETPAQREARMKWFADARFGMFIHWGLYSVPAGDWNGKTNYGEWFLEETHMPVSQYEKFAGQFNPVKFDAKQWVGLAKEAGVKYIVITSKHHDGFGLFPSAETDWCIKSTPFKRDPLKELSEACREAGIRFCTYYSIMDWHHPDWGTRRAWNDVASGKPDMDRYTNYMKAQLKEIVTNYHPGIMWFDGEWESPWTADRGDDLYKSVRSLDPAIIVNNRVGKGRAGLTGMDKGRGAGDYGTPEQEVPANGFGPGVYWESCMTMNNHWGYNKHDQHWKSTADLVRILVDCASKGGNYLLNVGPTSEGLFPEASVERLKGIGAWMKINSASIYDTTASTIGRPKWGRSTTNGDTIYLHVFEWPKDGKLIVNGVARLPEKAWLLSDANKKALGFNLDGTDLWFDHLPKEAPDTIDSVIVLRSAR